MIAAPGVTFASATAPPPSTTSPRTGAWFVTGVTERGPVGQALTVGSMSDYQRLLGNRIPAGALYDALDQYFRDGGVQAYVSRVVGPAAAPATLAVKDGAATPATTITVNANGPGAWGNTLTVQVTSPGAGQYQMVISQSGTVVETSPVLSSPADAVNWSSTSTYVTISNAGSSTTAPNNNPAVLPATPLAGGMDDNAAITEAAWTTALAAFTQDMGPGQVSAPGRTTDPAHQALVTHATINNRIALLDAPDTPTATTLTTAATNTVTGGLDGSRATLLAPWVTIPGLPTGGPIPAPNRVVPPSALAAARCCAADQTGNPATAAAGPAGKSAIGVGVTQTYVDTDRATLNTAGVSLIRALAGVVQLYGFRSLSPDPQWVALNRSRLRMAIQDRAQQAGAAIEWGQLDAGGKTLSAFNGALRGILTDYWQIGALWGANPSDAFSVNTSPQVNTPTTIAAGYANAVIQIKPSGTAEFVSIVLQSVPLGQPVAGGTS